MSEAAAVTPAIPPSAVEWLTEHHQAVLITLRRDGTPQSSNVAVAFDPASGTFGVSVTDDRAKTRNMRRDPRGTLHVLGSSFWSYAAVGVIAELGPVTSTPGDRAGQDLLAVYERITTPHPDPAEYFQAMVDEHRLVLTLRPVAFFGSNLSG
jgi:PPOX class probable F420-dependent enzyme